MKTNYDDLVSDYQSGKINALDFLLAQDDISPLYLEEINNQKINPTPENAKLWLSEYENKNLYNQ